ncbi:hypothetical protein NDA10_007758 [Ustilago hordei]|uniref:uncharacterized protein n=1 Tax=Ustilago hordei TaxID=120017 RepID=UPI001A5594AB|nr:uncharacterized protein UHO2_04070 [Ustilago hordei]KAJ1037224.1 hypothetical protein NDA10_007758 [Ustilago hordei]SYW86573.1 uncharacterized protein UHO2_04070 [Ustilago hordei]
MTEPTLQEKLEEMMKILKRAEERVERIQTRNREHLKYHRIRLESLEAQYQNQVEESMIEEPSTPTPAPRPQRSMSFMDQSGQLYSNYEKYAIPTRPRYNQTSMGTPKDVEGDDTMATRETSLTPPKSLATPFPKFNLRDVEIFLIEAKAWFMFN